MKIVIVGGGTAGWLSALFITKIHPEHNVVMIESSKIGIVGAGEASTGLLRGILNNIIWDFGCNEHDFMTYANATPKLGIDYINWSGDGKNYIAPIDTPIQNYTFGTDAPLSFCISNNIPIHLASVCGNMIENGMSSFYLENDEIKNSNIHSYLFDAKLAGEYFKSICNQVTVIDAVVTDICTDNNGIVESLSLDNGDNIAGDFFIDASGFSRIFSKKMNVEWKSYDKEMVVDAAMPFLLDHEKDIRPLIEIHALKSGWMWKTPRLYDYGCGFVYNSEITKDEDAKKEVEEYLQQKIQPIKFLKFNTGRLENSWNKNVLSVGLSSSFLEPLEGTSIHSTIIQLATFCINYLKSDMANTINDGSIALYNDFINNAYEDMKNFVLIHYSARDDTDFWKNAKEKAMKNEMVSLTLKMSKTKLCNFSDTKNYYGSPGPGLYNWALAGLNYFQNDAAKKELSKANYDAIINAWDKEMKMFFSDKKWIKNNDLIKILQKENNSEN